MSGILDYITLKDIIYIIVGFVAVFSVVAEKTKSLPFSPWTKFFEWIGERLTKSMDERLDKIEEQQKANNDAIIKLDNKVDEKFKEKQKDDDEKEAKRLRANIIEFADSCRCGNHHTQNHFENVMRDYSDYVHYCETHGIPNHFIDSEYKYIEGIYQNCLIENSFL